MRTKEGEVAVIKIGRIDEATFRFPGVRSKPARRSCFPCEIKPNRQIALRGRAVLPREFSLAGISPSVQADIAGFVASCCHPVARNVATLVFDNQRCSRCCGHGAFGG